MGNAVTNGATRAANCSLKLSCMNDDNTARGGLAYAVTYHYPTTSKANWYVVILKYLTFYKTDPR